MDSPIPSQLYVWQDGLQEGPFSKSELKRDLEQGVLSPETLVWGEGMTEWIPLGLLILNQPTTQETAPPAGQSTFFALSCQNCGGQLDYTSGDDIAKCPFCGSTHIIRQAMDALERLRDLENDSLSVSYHTPVIAAASTPEVIVAAIQKEKAGFKNPENLRMKVDALYFPAWCIRATVQCSWHGEYSETRSVIKYRKVRKTLSSGRSHEVDEPYNSSETFGIPRAALMSLPPTWRCLLSQAFPSSSSMPSWAKPD